MHGLRILDGWPAVKGCVVLLTTIVASCATLPPECRAEYAHTLAHCPDRPRRIQTPEECKHAGGVSIYKDGSYLGCASREEIRQMFNGPWLYL
jgi:hypothetical protein